jgi:hypothetical protein
MAYAGIGQSGGSSSSSAGTSNFQRMWPSILRNMLGMGRNTDNVFSASVAAAAATTSTTSLLGILPEEAWIDYCVYYPTSTQAGATSPNGRQYSLFVNLPQNTTSTTIANTFSNASPWYGGVTKSNQLILLNAGSPGSGYPVSFFAYRNSSGAITSVNSLPGTSMLSFTSAGVGTGQVEPGGIVEVRFNTRFRNYSVSGSLITQSGVYNGWANFFANRPKSQGYYYQTGAYFAGVPGEVNVSANAASGATSVTCDALAVGLTSGTQIAFNNGVTATLTSSPAAGATTFSVSALSGAVPLGSTGFAKNGAYGYESLTGIGMTAILHGINDCNSSTFDLTAFKETYRAMIANASCAYMSNALQSNIVYNAGNGAAATWATHTQPAGGQFWNPQSFVPTSAPAQNGAVKMFSGAIGSTKPTITITIPPSFEGGTINLFFLGLAGANNGGVATIAIDGGATIATVDTSGVSATANQTTLVGTTAATTTLTATSGTFANPNDMGKFVIDTTTPANITAGTYIANTDGSGTTISSIGTNATTTATLSAAGAGAGTSQSLTLLGFAPMVKRLTGLAAGAHTIVITLTSIGAGTVPRFFFYGYGIEASNTLTPDLSAAIAVCNVAHVPSGTSTQNTNVTNANAALVTVLNGTATTFGSNSVEPALNSQAFLVDIDTALGWNGTSVGNSNFSFDGLHPNARGHAVIADTIYKGMISTTGITPVNLAVTSG